MCSTYGRTVFDEGGGACEDACATALACGSTRLLGMTRESKVALWLTIAVVIIQGGWRAPAGWLWAIMD